ncbi:hypothetical protein ACFO25_05650 [Paenactinomyces guangxiensis]|uniref:Uncharacterized protein n=1 Tax=Paenactinomyces guangxiensis TaxID=1490290 RepID=A0A7W2A8L3_9BACL|nr:hypothetical protein [Paenactinomyces guangxiensis]MBA4494282.1 hypothetical protein [Paenactinomyces guangxiensis]MBH8590776.1 hypothetical protein [Paenactinomyces guangxiensis]
MQLTDALFNWLQIQIVWEARSSDRSARDTVLFFEEILREDHQVEKLEKKIDGDHYVIKYEQNGSAKSQTYPREAAEKLLKDILAEPKYNQSFE